MLCKYGGLGYKNLGRQRVDGLDPHKVLFFNLEQLMRETFDVIALVKNIYVWSHFAKGIAIKM